MKHRIAYLNDKLRACPCYEAWQRATQLFISRNAVVDRLAMDKLSSRLSAEWNSHAYQAGPKGRLP